jgi:hypothetical protein
MKSLQLLTTFCLTFILSSSLQVNAQKFSGLDKSPMDAAIYRADRNGPALAKVIYSRPQLNGRDLSSLAPNGKVWRTGANESSEITFYNDATIGGKSVKAGTYTLVTIPGEKEWTIIINSDINTWGSYSYDQSKDVARVMAPVSMANDPVEAFAITFEKDGTMYLGWGKVRVAVPTFH